MIRRNKIISLVTIIFILLLVIYSVPVTSLNETEDKDHLEIEDDNNYWNGDLDNNKIDDQLDQKMLENSNENVNIYINYKTHPTGYDIENLNQFNVNISYITKYINTVCVRDMPLVLIPQIVMLSNVVRLELQPLLQPLLDISTPAMKARGSDDYSPNTAWELGYTGQGMTIAILDTGVDDRHDSLFGKFVAGVDLTQDESRFVPRDGSYNPDDVDGHGTHCAGIAMGTGGDDGEYIGVAYDAELVDVKVLNDWGPSPGDQLMQGLDWCIDYKDQFDIDILSISIGDLIPGNDDGQGATGQLINTAVDEGLIVVVAAGNDGPNNNGFSDTAAADLAITVGAIDDMDSITRNDDEIADFSSRGPRADDGDNDELDELKPDVVAPGVGIYSALYSVSLVGAITGYQAQSGTSMACPHVAGLTALMLEAFPDLTPRDIKEVLRESAEAMGSPYDKGLDSKYNEDYGWGMVDAHEAIIKCLGKYRIVEYRELTTGDMLAGKVAIEGSTNTELGEIELVELKIGDQNWVTANGTSTWNYEFDTNTLPNGQYKISAKAYNGVIYSNVTAIKIKINNLEVEISSPSNGKTVSDEIVVEGTVVGSKIQDIQIKIDNGKWLDADQVGHKDNSDPNNPTTVVWEYKWDTNTVSDGEHYIYVRAYGENKYNTPSAPIQILVDVDNSDTGLGEIAGISVGLLLIIIIFVVLIILAVYFVKKRQ